MSLRLPLLLAAVAALSPVAALAHEGPDDQATPEAAGATWRHQPPPYMAGPPGAPLAGQDGPDRRAMIIRREFQEHGPAMRPHDSGPPCPERHAFVGPPPHAMPPPPPLAGEPIPPHRMGPPPMDFAGPPPCGPCMVRRPVRLHDGWLSWPGKTYF